MAFDLPLIDFREYSDLSFLGKIGKFNQSNKKYPFIGYRGYSKEALPIIKMFSHEEFKFRYQLKKELREALEGYYDYEKKSGIYQLKESIEGKTDTLKKIWKLFRSTTFFSSYYKCFPYLLPDYNKSKAIENKFIYIFRQVKGSSNTTVYREFYVKSNKYYQGEIKAKKKADGNIDNLYLEDNRKYSKTGLNSISLPEREGSVEYEYIFILSQIKLSVARIETLRYEIKNNICNRGKKISVISNEEAYKKSRDMAGKLVKKAALDVKKSFAVSYEDYKKLHSEGNMAASLASFMPKKSLIPYFKNEDILYNTPNNPNANHTIFLIDYFNYTMKLKKDFDNKVTEYDKFLNDPKNGENGYSLADMKALNDMMSGLIKLRENDSQEMKEFKGKLKAKLKKSNGKHYAYENWYTVNENRLRKERKNIELSGVLLASAVDTGEFTSLQHDYYFLRKKDNVSESDKDIIKSIINKTGEIFFSLSQSEPGKLLLRKLSIETKSDLEELYSKRGQAIDVQYLYNNYASSSKILTWVLTYPVRKLIAGISYVFSIYVNHLPREIEIEIKQVITWQGKKLAGLRYQGKPRGASKFETRKIVKEGKNIPKLKGSTVLKTKGGAFRRENCKFEIESIKRKSFFTDKAFNILCFGLELYNVISAHDDLKALKSQGEMTTGYMSLAGAYFDLVSSAASFFLNVSDKGCVFINIISSSIDVVTSGKKAYDNLGSNDYAAAACNALAAYYAVGSVMSGIYIIKCIAIAGKTGSKAGSIWGIPGVAAGLVAGALCGLFFGGWSYLSAKFTDSDYENWFEHCLWGEEYGNGNKVPYYSEVEFYKWAKKYKGIEYQFRAFYNLFYLPKVKLVVKPVDPHRSTEHLVIGLDILPVFFDEKSKFKLLAKMMSYKNDLNGHVLCSEKRPLEICSSSNKKGVEIEHKAKKISIRWSNKKLDSKRFIFDPKLTNNAYNVYKRAHGLFIPYLEVRLSQDLHGDKNYVVKVNVDLEIERIYTTQKTFLETKKERKREQLSKAVWVSRAQFRAYKDGPNFILIQPLMYGYGSNPEKRNINAGHLPAEQVNYKKGDVLRVIATTDNYYKVYLHKSAGN